MAEDQNIRDLFHRYGFRDVDEATLARLRGTSNYYVELYIREQLHADPRFQNSPQYRENAARINAMHEQVYGRPATPEQILYWTVHQVSDAELLAYWRTTPEYKSIYAGKPAYMSESEYRKIYETKVVEAEGVRNAFSTFARRELSDADLNKIFFGGPGSDQLRREYARVRGLQASYEGSMKRGAATQVQLTPLGPVQPLMRGTQSAAGVAPSPEPPAPGPPTGPRWASYADYVAQNENPAYNPWKNSGIQPPPNP